MVTRQELVASINLIRHTCRLNKHKNELVTCMQLTEAYDPDKDPDGINQARFRNFDEHKEAAAVQCTFMAGLANRIDMVVQEGVPSFYAKTESEIPNFPALTDIETDVHTTQTLLIDAQPGIELAVKREDLFLASSSLAAYHPISGIEEPDPWAILSEEANHANILHDILDAMSYELQGRSSYTGELHELIFEELKKLINNRIFAGWVCHNKLSDVSGFIGIPNKEQMGDVLDYVQKGLREAKSNIDLVFLGQYIDVEIPKLIMVRRWWAL